jgi:hypothetical protein
VIIPAMPAITVDLFSYFKFLFDCAGMTGSTPTTFSPLCDKQGFAGHSTV